MNKKINLNTVPRHSQGSGLNWGEVFIIFNLVSCKTKCNDFAQECGFFCILWLFFLSTFTNMRSQVRDPWGSKETLKLHNVLASTSWLKFFILTEISLAFLGFTSKFYF